MSDLNNNSRASRVADQIQKELARLIQFEMKDPRIGFATVAGVKVSRDFAHAEIYISVLGKDDDEEAKKDTIDALNHGAGFLRSSLAKAIKLRTVPRLKFHYDNTVENGNKLSLLIDEAVESDKQNSEGQVEADSASSGQTGNSGGDS